jgi:hypothetical protein
VDLVAGWQQKTGSRTPKIKSKRGILKRNQKAGEKITTSTVMFVPSTSNGVLIKALTEAETDMSKMTRLQVRYQEAGVIQLASMFSTDLGKGKPCGREECCTCGRLGKNDRIQNCKQANIVYESSCLICNKEDGSNQKDEKESRIVISLVKLPRPCRNGPNNTSRMPWNSVKVPTW